MMFFFFKQKTAYEMRISDWSSDVCSSDLDSSRRQRGLALPGERRCAPDADRGDRDAGRAASGVGQGRQCPPACRRSEEHTSELQSLMRISYAVFCWKKKKQGKKKMKGTRQVQNSSNQRIVRNTITKRT